ncbi:MAG TPA: DoxX family protein [Planctomycetota bacterium]|jgi:uncharacterized membrane protein YphA (DoxX/SURF4 family)
MNATVYASTEVASSARNRAADMPVLLLRLALGGVLFYAGITKVRSGWQFAEAIANFGLLPAQANQILAVVLPWWEILAGVMLIFGVWVRASALLGLMLFLAFTVSVGTAMARGLDIQCGCFSDSASRVGMKALGIDIGGLLAAVVVAMRAREQTDSRLQHRGTKNTEVTEGR